MILELCGGEPSEVVLAGEAPAAPASFDFDPAYVASSAGCPSSAPAPWRF
jgi:phenylalanyl-tRNA synthetase beta chain